MEKGNDKDIAVIFTARELGTAIVSIQRTMLLAKRSDQEDKAIVVTMLSTIRDKMLDAARGKWPADLQKKDEWPKDRDCDE